MKRKDVSSHLIYMYGCFHWYDGGKTQNDTHDLIEKEADWQIVFSNCFSTFGITNRRKLPLDYHTSLGHTCGVGNHYVTGASSCRHQTKEIPDEWLWRTMNAEEHESITFDNKIIWQFLKGCFLLSAFSLSPSPFPFMSLSFRLSFCLSLCLFVDPLTVPLLICHTYMELIHRFVPY